MLHAFVPPGTCFKASGTLRCLSCTMCWVLFRLHEEHRGPADECCALLLLCRSRVTQAQAATALHMHDERVWCIRPAPHPSEIVYPSLGMTRMMRKTASKVQWAIFWVLAATYLIPVSALQVSLGL